MKSEFSEIFTPEEVAEITRTSEDAIIKELNAGRIQGFKIGDEWRITKEKLLVFMNGEIKHNMGGETMFLKENVFSLDWQQTDSFSYKWPIRSSDEPTKAFENYPRAYETEIDLPSGRCNVKIGYTTRKAAGIKDRQRITVFITIGSQLLPVVEFVGANDFTETRRVASIIKTKNGCHVRSADLLPVEYKNMRTATYSDVVKGPYASHGLAVIADVDDRDTMLRHALIRVYYKGWIKD